MGRIAISKSKWLEQAGWKDVPHLSEEEIGYMVESTPPYLLPARQYGDPVVGIGRIYPFDINKILIDPFPHPPHWPKVYGFDPSQNLTAALWAMVDEINDVRYIFGEYYAAHNLDRLHSQSIMLRGDWVPGVADPACQQKRQDGIRTLQAFRTLGLNLTIGDNAVQAGIQAVIDLITTGRLKIFSTLQYLRMEFNGYRRDKHGKIVKMNDHLMDCLRYLALGGFNLAMADPKVVGGLNSGFGFTGAADERAGLH